MATDTVTNNSDDGTMVGSLRYELAHANAGDTINFAPGITSITLTEGLPLGITTNLTIEGSQPNSIGTLGVTIDGQHLSTDFFVNGGVTATIDGLSIQNGQDSSTFGVSGFVGGIEDQGTLTLSHSVLANNVGSYAASPTFPAQSQGGNAGGSTFGAIYVAGGATLNLVGTTNTFTGNKATGGSGGLGGDGTGQDPFTGAYEIGGSGGTGAYAADGKAKTPATAGTAGSGSYAGAGGAPGKPGMAGQSHGMGYQGAGGGGGGGNAFADYGGPGTVNVLPVCFASGTLIQTTRGDVAVEALQIGDLVVTAAGAHRSIRWLGHRTIDCRRHPDPSAVWPVSIAAHAFGPGRPARDLVLSPGHSICVDLAGEMLVPAAALVNGSSIARLAVAEITYWHVELDTHDILLAENLPAESYLEMGNRAFFAEAEIVALDAGPDAPARSHADFCRPYRADGALVDAMRARLGTLAEALGSPSNAVPHRTRRAG